MVSAQKETFKEAILAEQSGRNRARQKHFSRVRFSTPSTRHRNKKKRRIT